MGFQMRSHKHSAVYLFCLIFFLLSFQNCSSANLFSPILPQVTQPSASTSLDNGGATGGADGMRYLSHKECAGGNVGLYSEARVAKDFSTTKIIRDACQDLAVPKVVSNSVKMLSNKRVMILDDMIYDLQTASSGQLATLSQQITTQVCTGSSGGNQVEVKIWASTASSTFIYGSVSLTDKTGTGPLVMSSPAKGVYKSLASQASNFTLTIPTEVSYSINGGAPSTVTDLKCLAQPLPPLPGVPLGNYAWAQEGFGVCSASCGGGTQTQAVKCMNNGNIVSDSLCAQPAPSSSIACNVQACGMSTKTFSPGLAQQFTVPIGVSQLSVTVIAGGGGGFCGGGGGGGGGEAKSTVLVNGGDSFAIDVGAGGIPGRGWDIDGSGGRGANPGEPSSFTGNGISIVATGGLQGNAPTGNSSGPGFAGGDGVPGPGIVTVKGGDGTEGILGPGGAGPDPIEFPGIGFGGNGIEFAISTLANPGGQGIVVIKYQQ